MKRRLLFPLTIVILLVLAGLMTLAAESPAYRLDTGDVIGVSVWGHDDLKAEARVGPDGRVTLPLLGEVSVRGCTLSEITDLLRARYGELVRDPQITVVLIARRQISVKVFGQVNQPGAFLVHPGASIAELIAMAGGPAKRAALEKTQLLRNGDPNNMTVIPQGQDDEFGLGTTVRGPELSDGDVIFVPETKKVDWQFVFAVLGGLLTLKQLVS